MYENENKQEKHTPPAQKFYFNEEGKLVVETNKGVWVDGEQYAKMYGIFTCNAKTIGIIIQHLKGIPVEIGIEEKVRHATDSVVDDILNIHEHTIEHYCIIGANKERIKEYEHEFAKQEFVSKKINELQKKIGEDGDKIYELKKSIEKFNKLPWWKRMFKKIKINEKL